MLLNLISLIKRSGISGTSNHNSIVPSTIVPSSSLPSSTSLFATKLRNVGVYISKCLKMESGINIFPSVDVGKLF